MPDFSRWNVEQRFVFLTIVNFFKSYAIHLDLCDDRTRFDVDRERNVRRPVINNSCALVFSTFS